MTGKLPDGLYFELLKWARENRISYKQLLWMLVRDELDQRRGWKCPHAKEDIKYSRKIKRFYCKSCYSFMDLVNGRDFIPVKSVWERKQEMTLGEWSAMMKPDNKSLK